MYDWANSAFVTTIVGAVFPIYFHEVAVASGMTGPQATERYAWITTLALAIVAIMAPALGAIADYAAAKKKMLGLFVGVGVVSTAAMFFIVPGGVTFASATFVLANIGVASSFVFYDSLLPHVASEDEVDRVSTAGYALGYIGGGLLLALNLAWIQKPHWFGLGDGDLSVRVSFLSVAVWWLAFSVPLFRRVPEPARRLADGERAGENPIAAGFARLAGTFRELRTFKNAFLMLVAFLIYNDGIQTIIRMASTYGTEIGLDRTPLIAAFVVTQFVGIPFAFLFGALAGRIGAKRAVFLALAVYTGIAVLGYHMRTAVHFLTLAVLVGTVQGGAQALSRSMFASMIPRHKSSEYFGFFGVFEKFAGIFGPAVFASMVSISGSSRGAILSVIGFFVVGGVLLAFVNVGEGRQAARAAEARYRPAP
jgi:UMF1 family MFS transporter